MSFAAIPNTDALHWEGALAGVRILDLTRIPSGPFKTQTREPSQRARPPAEKSASL
jgi:hypothetical protein